MSNIRAARRLKRGGHEYKEFEKPICTINVEDNGNVIVNDGSVSRAITVPSNFTPVPTKMKEFRYPMDVEDDADDQDFTESCVAFALAQMMEIGYYRAVGECGYDFFCSQWIYGNRVGFSCKDEGMYTEETLVRLLRDGVPLKQDVKTLYQNTATGTLRDNLYELTYELHNYKTSDDTGYTANSVVTATRTKVMASCKMYKPCNYYPIGTSDITSMKNALVAFSPIYFAIDTANPDWAVECSKDYVLDKRHYGGEKCTDVYGDTYYLMTGSHVMIIVGWTTVSGKECWIVKNSWGSWYGDDGYLYIPTSIFPSVGREVFCFDFDAAGMPTVFNKKTYWNSIWSSSIGSSTGFDKGKGAQYIFYCDIFNNLNYHINVRRKSVGLSPTAVEWLNHSSPIKASLFNSIKKGFNEYTTKKYGKNVITLADKKSGDSIKGTEIKTLLDAIENNI